MATHRFTDRWLRALQPPETGQAEWFDETLPKFGIRVSFGGTKTFFVVYRAARRQRRYKIGRYPELSLADARDTAKATFHSVAIGEDPAAARRADRRAISFGDLAHEYVERHAKVKKRTWREDERVIAKETAIWQNVPAKSIERSEIKGLLEAIVKRKAPIMANRTLEIVRKVYAWACDEDIFDVNPCLGIKAPSVERQRDRVLCESEISAVWAALDDESDIVAGIFRLLLITAQRRREVLRLHREELELDTTWWTIPADRSKNGLAHRVPLSDLALETLARVRANDASPWVFPSERGSKDGARNTIQKAVMRVRERSGVSFRIHDLRRTAASHMASMGVGRLVLAKVLNHAETGATAVYDRHSYDVEKREALEGWANRLREILDPNHSSAPP